MMTVWMHDSDPLWPLFLARMIVLAAAVGMGSALIVGALAVRRLIEAWLWFGQRRCNSGDMSARQRAMN